ncbi:MAG: hypothetical protein HPY74_08415 [Firmicutes bacterium]|nr:hypothetical protein [Bacillota bacterium]
MTESQEELDRWKKRILHALGRNGAVVTEIIPELEWIIVEGMSNKEIADRLEITINTVKGYIKNIYEKLGVNRRVQVVTRAKELKILKNK